MLCVRCFLNASFYAKAQNSDASFRIWRKSGFADYTSELHKALPEATPRVLDIQLKELVEDGLVKKTIFPELPPRSEYSITSLGLTLIPIIDAMLEWGKKNKDLFERKYGK